MSKTTKWKNRDGGRTQLVDYRGAEIMVSTYRCLINGVRGIDAKIIFPDGSSPLVFLDTTPRGVVYCISIAEAMKQCKWRVDRWHDSRKLVGDQIQFSL